MAKNTVQIIIEALGSAKVQQELGRIRGAFGKLTGSVGSLGRQLFSLKGLIAGVGAGLLAKSFLHAASTSEQFRSRLNVLLGSVKEGNRLFREMADYASKVPFQYEEIMGAATQLAGVMKGGVDEIKRWMPLIGDLAAASGLSIQETTEQVIRMYSAGAASADLFRERGILAMMGFKAGVSYTAEETRKKMFEEWQKAGSQFKNATDELADDWDGLISMMGDKWFKFKNMVMNAAPFDYLKAALKMINDYLDENKKTVDDIAERIGNGIVSIVEKVAIGTAAAIDVALPRVEKLWGVIKDLWDEFRSLPGWVQHVGLIAAFVGGKKGTAIVLGLTHIMDAVKNSARGLAEAFAGNIKFSELATMNYGELKKKLEEIDPQVDATKENLEGLGNIDIGTGPIETKVKGIIDRLKELVTKSREAKEETEKVGNSLTEYFEKANADFTKAAEENFAKLAGGAGEAAEAVKSIPDPEINPSNALGALSRIRDSVVGLTNEMQILDRQSNVSGQEALVQRLAWLQSRSQPMATATGFAGWARDVREMYAREAGALEETMRKAGLLPGGSAGAASAGGGQAINVTVGPIYTTAGRDDGRALQEDIADSIRTGRSPIIPAIRERFGLA